MFVFFNANNAAIDVSIDKKHVGSAADATALLAILDANAVSLADNLMHSSDVDFASEEGFASDSAAHDIIDAAIAQL